MDSRDDSNANNNAAASSSTTTAERPVPQPRRVVVTSTSPPNGASYENVRLDATALKKSTPLNNENLLQDAATHPRPSKVPNNKSIFAFPPAPETPPSAAVAAAAGAVSDALNGNAGLPQSPNTSSRLIITEMNNLNLDVPPGANNNKNHANKDFEESHKLQNLPVPAPRRMQPPQQQQQPQDIYESNEDVGLLAANPQQQQQQQPHSTSSSSSSGDGASPVPYKPVVQQSATGAISKQPRQAPPLPLLPSSSKLNNTTGTAQAGAQITVNTASGVLVDGGDAADELQPSGGHDLRRNQRLNKSNVSLSSTTSGGSSSGSPKYAKDSPR